MGALDQMIVCIFFIKILTKIVTSQDLGASTMISFPFLLVTVDECTVS